MRKMGNMNLWQAKQGPNLRLKTKFGLVIAIFSHFVTPQTRGSVDYPSTRGIQVDVGLPDTISENRAESPLYGELYP